MIAKTVLGSSFLGAITYGAAEKQSKKSAKLIDSHNIMGTTAEHFALQMQSVANRSKCQNPVWHTSLSWSENETIDEEKMRKAARLYCEGIGANLDRHQVVVYQHFDQKHPHIHIYLNRIPIGGGIALDSSHNYTRNVKVCREIEKKLSFQPLPKQRTSLSDHLPLKMQARQKVKEALSSLLLDKKINSIDKLSEELTSLGIESRFKYDRNDKLVGCSFRVNEVAIKGTEVDYKAKQIEAILRKNSISTDLEKESRGVVSKNKTVAFEQGHLIVKSSVHETNADLSKIEKSLWQSQMQLRQIKHNAKKMTPKKLVKKPKKM